MSDYDRTLEGSITDGAPRGVDAVRDVLVYIHKLHERQGHSATTGDNLTC